MLGEGGVYEELKRVVCYLLLLNVSEIVRGGVCSKRNEARVAKMQRNRN